MSLLEQDQKQYQLMANYLHQFKKGQLQLDRLINVLEALLEALQMPDEKWKENFRSEWWTLEQVYAVALDREQTTLSPEDHNLVIETIENIELLLKRYL